MNRNGIEILCFMLAIVLTVAGCFALSGYAAAKVRTVKGLLDALPPGARGGEAAAVARQIEEELAAAAESLALIVRYDQVNRAQSAATAYTAALSGDERSDVEAARRALEEALESLLRLEDCSLELFL